MLSLTTILEKPYKVKPDAPKKASMAAMANRVPRDKT